MFKLGSKKIAFALCLYVSSLCGAPPNWVALVSDFSTTNVTPIDLSTNTLGANFVLPYNVADIGISNDGNTAYVVSSDQSTITVLTPIDLNTNTVGTDIVVANTGSFFASHICMAPNGLFLYVLLPGDGTVVPVNLSNNTAGTPIPVTAPNVATSMFITPDGSTAYVSCGVPPSLVPIDLSSNTALLPIPLTATPLGAGVTPDGVTAYITTGGMNSVIPFDLATETEGAPIPASALPLFISITPDGLKGYVSNGGSSIINVIDLSTNTPGANISIASASTSSAVTPDGIFVYVCESFNNTVAIIDVATDTVVPPSLSPFTSPFFIRITPDQAPTAAFTMTSPGEFDASASSSPIGSIATYFWDFGDGQTVTTASPTISHQYAAPGNYVVTLTVTNTAGTSTSYVYTGMDASRNGGPVAQLSQNIVILPAPATDFFIERFKNRFLNATYYINFITWSPSVDPAVVGYNLYRDGKLIAVLPAAEPYEYGDVKKNKKIHGTYTLTAFIANGQESNPVSFTIN